MLTRRDLFQTLIVGAAVAGASPLVASKKYGRLTVQAHRAHLRLTGELLHVYLDGVRVDNGGYCYLADDVDGFIEVYCRDPEHHRRLDANGAIHKTPDGFACRRRVSGSVRIAPGPA